MSVRFAMPELAEVEFYRKQWNSGLKQKISSIHAHGEKRIFRGINAKQLSRTLNGATFLESRAHGKQMLFRFTKNAWLGLHLGMTGKLLCESPQFAPGKHDHLVLRQKNQLLVFHDPRLFGRVLFHLGPEEPKWWADLPPEITSRQFTPEFFNKFLKRHGNAPLKAVLLLQKGFPGIGNWMADEILWQSQIHPRRLSKNLDDKSLQEIFDKTCFVSRQALKIIGTDFSDPPKSWLFQFRWKKKGGCPRCKSILCHATIGGRTTCWCPQCQP